MADGICCKAGIEGSSELASLEPEVRNVPPLIWNLLQSWSRGQQTYGYFFQVYFFSFLGMFSSSPEFEMSPAPPPFPPNIGLPENQTLIEDQIKIGVGSTIVGQSL